MVSSADGELELELMLSKYDNWFWWMKTFLFRFEDVSSN